MIEQSHKVTVGQLIEMLKAFPAGLPVLVSGYESGYEGFEQPKTVRVTVQPENPYYDGEFQAAEQGDEKTIETVVLQRITRDV